MRTDVNACDCARGCTDTVREPALKVDWEKNPLLHRGIEPASAACRSDALPTELHPPLCHMCTERLTSQPEKSVCTAQIAESVSLEKMTAFRHCTCYALCVGLLYLYYHYFRFTSIFVIRICGLLGRPHGFIFTWWGCYGLCF